MLRLPYEIKELFEDWLNTHEPLKAQRILRRIQDIRSGKLNDPKFGSRMRGTGAYADLIAKRFVSACRRFGLNESETTLDTTRFIAPIPPSGQMSLL